MKTKLKTFKERNLGCVSSILCAMQNILHHNITISRASPELGDLRDEDYAFNIFASFYNESKSVLCGEFPRALPTEQTKA